MKKENKYYNKVYDQLSMWGRSKDKDYYERVLLRISPDDDKVKSARTQNGKVIFYNKKLIN